MSDEETTQGGADDSGKATGKGRAKRQADAAPAKKAGGGAAGDLVEYEVPEGTHVFCRQDKTHKGPGEIAMMPRSWVEAKAEEEEGGVSPLEGVPTLDYGAAKRARAPKRPTVRRE